MIGVVLIALSVVILIGFMAFGIAKTTVSDGSSEVQKLVADFNEDEFSMYDEKEVLGRDVLSVFKTYKDDSLAIFIHTIKMDNINVKISNLTDRHIQFYDKIPYVNYGSIISIDSSSSDIEDTILVKKNEPISDVLRGNMNSIVYPEPTLKNSSNGSGIILDGLFCVDDNGIIITDKSISDFSKTGTVEFINPKNRFDSKLVRNYNNEIVGLMFFEIG